MTKQNTSIPPNLWPVITGRRENILKKKRRVGQSRRIKMKMLARRLKNNIPEANNFKGYEEELEEKGTEDVMR